jgi:hypothetical protein
MSKHCTTFHEGDQVYCMSGRQVIHCGYEYEYKDALSDLAERLGVSVKGINHYDDTHWGIDEDLYRKIFFDGVGMAEPLESIRKALEEIGRKLFPRDPHRDRFDAVVVSEQPCWMMQQIARLVIHDAALCQLRTRVKGGNKRTLTFAPLPPDAANFPYQVWMKRTVKTGTYYPPDEEGSGGLYDVKTHVILYARATSSFLEHKEVQLLAADCVHPWELEMVDRLRKEA